MKKDTDVLIIGTGTAALAAASEVCKVTSNFLIISNGVYGTTCVRAGCMPAKMLIHAAELFCQRNQMERIGFEHPKNLRLNSQALLNYIRNMREYFLGFVLENTENYRDHIIEGRPRFLNPTVITTGGSEYHANKVIIATGSSPIIPAEVKHTAGDILTSDNIFDLKALPSSLDVVGLSVLGTEIAQALSHLGCEVNGYHGDNLVGGVSDPEISKQVVKKLREDMNVALDISLEETASHIGTRPVFVAMSRMANLGGMGLEEIGICNDNGLITNYNAQTMQVGDLPVFAAGDVKYGRSILHEAVDEGRIAGYNATRSNPARFKRRVALQITHTRPTIAVIGSGWTDLAPGSFVTGKAEYENQGCAV